MIFRITMLKILNPLDFSPLNIVSMVHLSLLPNSPANLFYFKFKYFFYLCKWLSITRAYDGATTGNGK